MSDDLSSNSQSQRENHDDQPVFSVPGCVLGVVAGIFMVFLFLLQTSPWEIDIGLVTGCVIFVVFVGLFGGYWGPGFVEGLMRWLS